jgi:hypothetical protein
MVSIRTQKFLAVTMIVLGLSQAATAFTQDSLTWSLFYVIFGGGVALSGVGFLWDAMKSAEQ